MTNKETIAKCLVMASLFGSRAHGTQTPQSDLDIRGVYIPDYDDILSPFPVDESLTLEGDTIFFEVRHFAGMVANCNPNILDVLWAPQEVMLHVHPAWREFHDYRYEMLSQKVGDTYSGYANGELKRLEKLMKNDEMSPENQYRMRKSVAHVVRLLRMAHEVLNGQGLIIFRPDRSELLAIKNGLVPLKSVLESVITLKDGLEKAKTNSVLPKEPQFEVVKKSCNNMLKKFWSLPQTNIQGIMHTVLGLPDASKDVQP